MYIYIYAYICVHTFNCIYIPTHFGPQGRMQQANRRLLSKCERRADCEDCCGVLQCVEACCNVLQCVTACCSMLQQVAVCFSVLQCATVCHSVLLRVAACCSMLQYVAVCCSMLQCAAVCCSVSQRAAACCSMLQFARNIYIIYDLSYVIYDDVSYGMTCRITYG